MRTKLRLHSLTFAIAVLYSIFNPAFADKAGPHIGEYFC